MSTKNNSTHIFYRPEPIDGYDLPLYGINDGRFYTVHIPALVCICFSLLGATTVLVLACQRQKHSLRERYLSSSSTSSSSFYSWTKGERFVVYLSICDGLFGSFHLIDHVYILATRRHVRPHELCEFFGFVLVEFIGAQIFMVNVIAINAFLLIYFRKNLDFGKYDHRLLLWTFGMPLVTGSICLALGALGPNGAFCFFDGIKGEVANVIICSVLLSSILLLNITLYMITWYRIRKEEFDFKTNTEENKNNETLKASHRAARSMSLLVAAFIIQWWAMALYGVWQLNVKEVPLFLFQFGTIFSNIGGILNAFVYFFLRRQRRIDKRRDEQFKPTVQTPKLGGKRFNYELVGTFDKSS